MVAKHVRNGTKLIPLNKDKYQCSINEEFAEHRGNQCRVFSRGCFKIQQEDFRLQCFALSSSVYSPNHQTTNSFTSNNNRFLDEGSNDEALKLRKSAAIALWKVNVKELVHTEEKGAGFVRVIVDNFDANISSQKGLQSTHAPAILLTQTYDRGHHQEPLKTIRQINKDEKGTQVDKDVVVQWIIENSHSMSPDGTKTSSRVP